MLSYTDILTDNCKSIQNYCVLQTRQFILCRAILRKYVCHIFTIKIMILLSIRHTSKLPQNAFEKFEQYLDLISKVVLANNGILRKTIAKDFTEQDKESLKNEINIKVAKLFDVK